MNVKTYYDRYWSPDGFNPTASTDADSALLLSENIASGDDLLDVGCGDGGRVGRWAVLNDVRYVGVDVSQQAVERAVAAGFDARLVDDASHLPFDEASFDVVTCIEVLEHLFEPHRAAAEALRVLRPGGHYLVSVPNVAYWRRRVELGFFARWNPFGDDRSTREPWRDPHIRFFTPRTLARMLELQGFKVLTVRGIGGAFLSEFPLVRRVVRRTSRPYRFLQRRWPTLFATRLHVVAVRE